MSPQPVGVLRKVICNKVSMIRKTNTFALGLVNAVLSNKKYLGVKPHLLILE